MIQFVKAKDYYGKHATGWVFIVDGHPYCHGSLADCKERVNCTNDIRSNKMIEKWSSTAFPTASNHPVWTRPYYGVQHRKNTSKRIQITVVQYETGARAYFLDKDLYAHLNQSNFTASKEVWCNTVEEARAVAETWN